MRLGDLGQLYDAVSDNWCGTDVASVSDILNFIKDSPTIAPETLPIVQELRSRNKRLKAVVKVQLEQLREKTSVIDELCEKVADLDEKLQRVTKERDAAVSEIESIIAYGLHLPNTCPFCKNEQCKMRGGTEPCIPKWRGIQEVQKDE